MHISTLLLFFCTTHDDSFPFFLQIFMFGRIPFLPPILCVAPPYFLPSFQLSQKCNAVYCEQCYPNEHRNSPTNYCILYCKQSKCNWHKLLFPKKIKSWGKDSVLLFPLLPINFLINKTLPPPFPKEKEEPKDAPSQTSLSHLRRIPSTDRQRFPTFFYELLPPKKSTQVFPTTQV